MKQPVTIPDEVLRPLLIGDYVAAYERLEFYAKKQSDHLDLRYRDAVRRVEDVYRSLHRDQQLIYGTANYHYIRTYQARIAYYAHTLGVDHLIRDIRENPRSSSLRYFLWAKGHVCRWESHVITKREAFLIAQAEQWRKEMEDSEAPVPPPAAPGIPDFVANSVREVETCLLRNDLANAKRIILRVANHGWNITVSPDGKSAVPTKRGQS